MLLAAVVVGIVAITVVGPASVGAASSNATIPVDPAHGASGEQIAPRGRLTPLRHIPAGAEVVHFGIEPIQAYGVNFDTNTWSCNFYMWWRWTGDIDPVQTTAFDNASSPASFFSITYSYVDAAGAEAPTTLSNGDHYQLAFIQAQFTDNFRLQQYPLDRHDLEMRFESTTYPSAQLVYVPDEGGRTSQRFLVPDWTTKRIAYGTYVKHYETDFGDPSASGEYKDWSLATYRIEVSRPHSHFVVALLLPLCFVLSVVISVLLLKAEHEASRLAIAATGLLTVIFLQQGYARDLPPTAPVVLMDKIYGLGFAVVFVVIARVIWETFQVFHHKRESHPYVRMDRVLAATLAVVFAVGATLIILSA